MKEFKIGDRVKTIKGSAIDAEGIIIEPGGRSLGFPWDDQTPHYAIGDIRTGVLVICHPESLLLVKEKEGIDAKD